MLRDEKGVSPVVGVILMVAITVILAAVIASFVFSYSGKLTEAPPQVQLKLDRADDSDDTIKITHTGGDAIDLKDLRIIVEHQGNKDVYEPCSAGGSSYVDAFSVGQQMTITVDADGSGIGYTGWDTDTIKIDGSNAGPYIQVDGLDDLVAGHEVKITFVHVPSGQTIAVLSSVVQQ